jgi:HEAT repeat protein
MQVLSGAGFNLIDTDRSALSCKLWRTKVKRLRVPDLLCLNCGARIEVRAKGQLGIIMSHSPRNPERAWDQGLRDNDLVASLLCTPIREGGWRVGGHVGLFRVADLRATVPLARLSSPKAASEGKETTLQWPSIVPTSAGRVEEVTRDKIVTRREGGGKQSYRLTRKHGGKSYRLHPHVQPGDRFGAGDRILASVVPALAAAVCPGGPYDFVSDLSSGERVAVFCAARALGTLPALKPASVTPLSAVMRSHEDRFVRLEAAGALVRLRVKAGADYLREVLAAGDERSGERMEAALLLGELTDKSAAEILLGTARATTNPSELRAASVWGLTNKPISSALASLTEAIADPDNTVALHALVALSRLVTETTLPSLLALLGDDPRRSAAVVKAIQLADPRPVGAVTTAVKGTPGKPRSWLIYLLACWGREVCQPILATEAPDLLPEVETFWPITTRTG